MAIPWFAGRIRLEAKAYQRHPRESTGLASASPPLSRFGSENRA